jgi:hypothetical protein
MTVALDIVKYCAEEVSRQMDGPLEVLSMVEAWQWAQEWNGAATPLTIEVIRHLGTLVHPWENREGFRRHDIAVGALEIGVHAYELQVKLERLCRAIKGEDSFEYPLPLVWRKDIKVKTTFKTIDRKPGSEDTPESYSYANVPAVVAYYNFEKIHPFADGNGRTGKILMNWINGTLDAPLMPPNFFGCSNP